MKSSEVTLHHGTDIQKGAAYVGLVLPHVQRSNISGLRSPPAARSAATVGRGVKMQTWKKVHVFLSLAALSVSASWATDGISFVAKATLDGLKVVPPVLTTVVAQVCLEFLEIESQPLTTATGEAVPQVLAGNPGIVRPRPPGDEVGSDIENVRFYLGQRFTNGRPIVTLCDNAIKDLQCGGIEGGPFIREFKLSDFRFQRPEQQNTGGFSVTVAGIRLDVERDIVHVTDDIFRLGDTETALALIKALIKRGLIYVVINSEFKAILNKKGKIIRYRPRRGFIDGDGESRGTLGLAPEGLRCPRPPPE